MIKAHIPLELHNIGPGEFRLMGAEIMLRVGAPVVIDERGFVVSRITFYGDNGTNFKIERQPDYDILPANRIESGKTSNPSIARSAFEGGVEAYGLSVEKYIKSTDGFVPIGTDRASSYKYWFIETLDHARWEKFKTRCVYLAGIDTHEHSVQQRMEELSREWNVRLKEIHRNEISPEEYASL